MKGDFTRRTFDRRKHYSSVRMQQGRVQLDADWNEQMDIFDYRQRLQFADFLGTSGAPHNSSNAFKIDIQIEPGFANQIIINSGRYYVEGLLCELEELLYENDSLINYTNQPYLPNAPLPPPNQSGSDILYLAYIDAWQRHVTALEDPTISEVALNGADTCTRLQNVAQVKLLQINNAANLNDQWNEFLTNAANSGFLAPVLDTNHSMQNQFYRIEIHDNGASSPPSFKWSRDNAYVATSITLIGAVNAETEQTTEGPVTKYRSEMHLNEDNLLDNFEVGDWIEVSSVNYELHGRAGHFGQIINKINNFILTVEWHIWDGDIVGFIDRINALAAELSVLKIARRWESKPIQILPLSPDGIERLYAIENGLSIKLGFPDGLTNTFKTGDYWLIPTRALTNDIEWPKQANNFIYQPPHGVVHHFAQLALLRWQADNTWNLVPEDLRIIFPALQNLQSINAVQAAPTADTGAIYIDPNENVGIGMNIDLSDPANNPPPLLDERLRVNGTIVATSFVNTPAIITGFVQASEVSTNTLQVVNPLVGDNIITTANIMDNAITANKIVDAVVNPQADKIPKADSFGRLDSNWLGNYWVSSVANPPIARYRAAVAVANGKIYVIGGQTERNGGTAMHRVDEYDPQTNTWAQKTPIPGAVTSTSEIGASTIPDAPNDRIYVFIRDRLYEFDPNGGTNANGTWILKLSSADPIHPINRSYPVCVTWNNRIFVMGGYELSTGYSAKVEVYNPGDNSIRVVSSMNISRYWFAGGLANNKIYVFSGVTSGGSFTNSVEEFDPTNTITGGNGVWITKSSVMPSAGINHAVAYVGGKFYLTGLAGTPIPYYLLEYNPLTDTWPPTPVKPNRPHNEVGFMLSAVVNNKIYFIDTSVMDVYIPSGNL